MTSRSPSPPEQSAINEQAAHWLARRDAGWSAADAEAFAHWERADPRHTAAVRRLESTQQLLAGLASAPGLEDLRAEVDSWSQPPRLLRFPYWARAAVATAALLAIGLFGWNTFQRVHGFTGAYETATDAAQQLRLPDGSEVRLKEATALEVRYSQAERRLHLPRGEAHFEVVRDPTRPFLVTAGALSVRAVGTAFIVRHTQADVVEVLVAEGKVQVERTEGASTSGQAPRVLIAGDQLRWDLGRPAEPVLARSPAVAATGARIGRSAAPRLDFTNTTLADAVAQLNQHSRVQLEIADPSLASRAVGGTFSADNAEAFAAVLAAGGEIQAERVNANRIVLRPAP